MNTAKKLMLVLRGSGAEFSPLDITGLVQWLAPRDVTTLFQDAAGTSPAAVDTDPVRLVRDKSGMANHATAPSDAARWTLKTNIANGYPVLRAAGSQDFRYAATVNSSDMTEFIVYRPTDASVDQVLLNDTIVGTNRYIIQGVVGFGMEACMYRGSYYSGYQGCGIRTDELNVISVVVNSSATTVTVYANGRQGYRTRFGAAGYAIALQNIGSKLSQYFTGDLFERIVYNRVLTGNERAAVENYLLSSIDIPRDTSPNPILPLAITAYDASVNVLHPDVLDLGVGNWNGYRYWMAFTPYTSAANENPSIQASADGTTWEVPAGLTNPIDPAPGGGVYNSDTSLCMSADGVTMYCYYRDYSAAPAENINVRSSTDGITWSAEATLFAGAGQSAMSPSVLYDGAQYVMHAVNGTAPPYKVTRRTCATPAGVWSAPENCSLTFPAGLEPWHIDVALVDGVYYAAISEYVGSLHYATSSDGITWTYQRVIIAPSRHGFDARNIYRTSLVWNGAGFDAFYSAYSLASVERRIAKFPNVITV